MRCSCKTILSPQLAPIFFMSVPHIGDVIAERKGRLQRNLSKTDTQIFLPSGEYKSLCTSALIFDFSVDFSPSPHAATLKGGSNYQHIPFYMYKTMVTSSGINYNSVD